MREWLRRNARFLAIVLGIACLLEVTFDSIEGTKHNFEFPWGHYRATLAVLAVVFLIVGYLTRPRPARRERGNLDP